jgi:hypothetical protein
MLAIWVGDRDGLPVVQGSETAVIVIAWHDDLRCEIAECDV